MSESTIARLADSFEIGAHTMDHLALTTLSTDEARRQIFDSKKWVEDVTGKPCRVFCPPLGKFDASHHDMIREAGFVGYRTVEMMQVDQPRRMDGLCQMSTTLQAHPHPKLAYIKNAMKRRSVTAFRRAFSYQSGSGWVNNISSLIQMADLAKGTFQLWGHSWELDENNQWANVNQALAMMRHAIDQHQLISATNATICDGMAG